MGISASEPRDYGEWLDKSLTAWPGVELGVTLFGSELFDLGRAIEVRVIVAVFHE
jgi:hypothetical protein